MTQSGPALSPDVPTLDVSVILPVHNEAGHLRAEVDRIQAALEASPYSFEIIVVDDGSTDGSLDELADLAASGAIRVIRFAENRGSGSARKAGTRAANGRVVVWTDADMTYPNDQMPALVKELDGYDQVVGARTSEQGTHRAAPRAREVVHPQARLVPRRAADPRSQLGVPRVPTRRRAAVRVAAPPGFSCVTTITMTFLANGYSVKYVPIDYAPRSGRSKFHWWSDTPPLPHAGDPPRAVVQPAARVLADRCRAARCSASASSSMTSSAKTSASPRTRC